MKRITNNLLLLLTILMSNVLIAQIPNLKTYDWPTASGQAILSNKYKVTIKQNDKTISSQVICSNSKDVEIPNYVKEMRGRTFNWTMFSYDYSAPITVIVEDLFSTTVSDVEIVPSYFNISKKLSTNKKKVEFVLNGSKYVGINFKSSENLHTSDGVLKHMLMIFAENLETNVPSKTAVGTHVYSASSTVDDLKNAKVLYFPKGYHNLSRFGNVSNIGPIIGPKTGNESYKTIYFEGGAYVQGRITNAKLSNSKIIGRGVLSGRDFKWSERIAPSDGGTSNGGRLGVDSFDPMEAHIGIGEGAGGYNTISGVIVCDGAGHGVNLGHNATYNDTKFWGWHPNNDGFRPWGANNIVKHCFIRGCDDALYNKGLTVTNTVFWPSFNGSIMCMGWDGNYHTENSTMTDNYLIYPEWRNMGNNGGIVMSQVDYNMKGTKLAIKNLYVDGNIPALVNLHTNSGRAEENDYVLPNDWVGNTTVGYIDGISFENVIVKGKQLEFSGDGFQQTPVTSKSLIKGAVLVSPFNKYLMKNISFTNVKIDSKCITNTNKDTYFNIDAATTQNILFNGCPTAARKMYSVEDATEESLVFPNPVTNTFFVKDGDSNDVVTLYNSFGQEVLKVKGNQINVSTLANGVYFGNINGNKTFKIVK
ncbi:MAG: T9SS type A sorting domain-containing protein [Pseudarcicella sp.]|nr:T9SS type A sorting domain-containing protein [Pseudarcicella sp.]MBP6410710.1 T9SS type A sorting domain-containing protein [Pseudarcicella sp.]